MNEKDLVGSGHGLIEALSQYMPEESEENQGKPQDSRSPGRDSNWAPPEYESGTLPLH